MSDPHRTAAADFVESWAKSRIDQPSKVIAHHDDAARQLIAVSGFLQAAYLAVFTFGQLKEHLGGRGVLFTVLLVIPLISVVFCAAKELCIVPKDMNVYNTFQLLKTPECDNNAAVDQAIKIWCEELDRLARKKGLWLHAANISFIVGSLIAAALLTAVAMM